MHFLGLAPHHCFATLCMHHCSTCVALGIKAMMIWRRPHLPPAYAGSLSRVPTFTCWQLKIGVALVAGLNPTPHGTSWRQPCSTSLSVPKENTAFTISPNSVRAQVRFLAYHRIKPHAPPLVRTPVNSFEFHRCRRTPQVAYLVVSLRRSSLRTNVE